MLRVYELKGDRLPRNLPAGGLVGVWPESPWYYLFYREDALESIGQWLERNPGWSLASQYEVPYETWQDMSLSQPVIGRFRIELSAEFSESSFERGKKLDSSSDTAPAHVPHHHDLIPIHLDPGIVFGSGLHPTTHGCLLAISALFEKSTIRTALDYGTGSGILAVACALAGAEEVIAVDLNPLALCVASNNALKNGVSDKIGFVAANRLEVISARPDLLLMNLEWPILENILHGENWRSARWIVLAGFLPGRLQAVTELAGSEFHVVETSTREGWPTLTLCRPL